MEAHSRQTTEIVAPGELARRLMIRFDTPSPGGKRELIAWLAPWLEDAGLDAQVLARARAANIAARLKGRGDRRRSIELQSRTSSYAPLVKVATSPSAFP